MKKFYGGQCPPSTAKLFRSEKVTLKFIKLHEFFQVQLLTAPRGVLILQIKDEVV
jgi:hypothetical protein